MSGRPHISVPAATAAHAQAVLPRDDGAEAVRLELVRPLRANRQRPGARDHGIGKPQSLWKLAPGRRVAPFLFARRLVLSLLPRSVAAAPLFRRRVIIEGRRALFPMSALGRRHLTHDEFPRRDLLAHVLETLLALIVFSLVSRPCHRYDY
jgi:hypothetical protein